ncbi:MAG: hypothetical protein AAGA70_14060 [Pseudomonadota bacterium]
MAGNKDTSSDTPSESPIESAVEQAEAAAEESVETAAESVEAGVEAASDAASETAPYPETGDEAEQEASDADTGADTEETDQDTEEPSQITEEEQAPVAATASTMEHPEAQARGPGFFPLAFGGIVAGAIGFAAGYVFDLNNGTNTRLEELSGTLQTQSADIAALGEATDGLNAAVAELPPAPDLSGIDAALADLGGQVDAIATEISAIDTRLADVEARPVFSGDPEADEAAMAAAIDQIRGELSAQQAENAILAEDIRTMADEAAGRIAEAEARAEATASDATAQAAISELRIAIASGTPFAEPLAAVAEAQSLDVPEAISMVAESGVPTLAELEARFPAAARAALPLALQAIAGDTAGERLGAFLRSQVGGRSLEPQPGDDPDAVLSRAGAAVETGNVTAALEELTALPDPALDAMGDWIEDAAARVSALEALDQLAGTLGGTQ